jgi:glycosyltransferase involved in cell wall biosynthesis
MKPERNEGSSDNLDDYLIIDPPMSKLDKNIIELQNPPLVSFCIPTLNNESTIRRCLESISKQDYPHFEIIIIDGHSRDRTIEIADQFTDKILYDRGTYGSACQTGVDCAQGEIIALFDSDIVVPHDKWLRNAVQYFNYGPKISTVWPLYIAPPESPLFERLYQTNMYKIMIENRIAENKGLFGGGNSLFLKKCIEDVGGINRSIHWGADFEWAQRLKDQGYQVVFIIDPLYHDTMRSVREFARKQFTGAKTFSRSGFGLMGLSKKDILYEHIILGTKGMIKGLILDRDPSWLMFPVFLSIRMSAYGYTYAKNFWNDKVQWCHVD